MPQAIKQGQSVKYIKTKREVALVLEEIRDGFGKSKAEFASFIGMTPENYTFLSRGSVYPSYKVIALLVASGAEVGRLFRLSTEEALQVQLGKFDIEPKNFTEFDMNIAQKVYHNFAAPFGAAIPNFETWAGVVRKIREIDEKSEDFILKTVHAISEHEGSNGFRWRDVIRSTEKLREHIRKGNVNPNLNSRRKVASGVPAKPGKYGALS